ncbi:hypothetical protein SAMN05421690_10055 [Nitrosomonas sp. Nm51]|nr:hypothetical protein [Nitrosomonas sp. Nm51]SEQ98338.1 hypothetical protein SAMN05421690_10055 [Nitrosomonas sp. Nm51]
MNFVGVAGFRAKANKIFIERDPSNQLSDIGKSEMRSIANSVTTLRCFFKVIGVYPGYGGSHHAEVEMIGNGMTVSGLAFSATDFLFDFLETSFYFPACAVVLDDLLDGEIQVGGKERNPL